MSERYYQYNPERLKRIGQTRGPERARAYLDSRRGAMLRAEIEAKAARDQLREAMEAVNGRMPREPRPDPTNIWAGIYPNFLMIINSEAIVYEPGFPRGRQVGQGLSFA